MIIPKASNLSPNENVQDKHENCNEGEEENPKEDSTLQETASEERRLLEDGQ